MPALEKLIHSRAAELRVDQKVIHADMGEVTVREIDGRHVRVEDEHGDTQWVAASEIC